MTGRGGNPLWRFAGLRPAAGLFFAYLYLPIVILIVLSFIGYYIGRQRANALRDATANGGLATLPQYYGYYVALIAGLPALVIFVAGILFQGTFINWLLLGSLPAEMTDLVYRSPQAR